MADVKAENQSQLENSMFHECATHCLEWDELSRGIRARSWVPTIFITAQVCFFLHTHTHIYGMYFAQGQRMCYVVQLQPQNEAHVMANHVKAAVPCSLSLSLPTTRNCS